MQPVSLPAVRAQAVQASAIPLEQLAANPHVPEAAKLKEICRQFEAVLLREILHDAQKTVIASGLTEESTTSDIYKDMVTERMADDISRTGAFGLAVSLEAEFARQALSQPLAKEPALEH
jgi:Rod binding domain-containing protein